MLDQLLAPLIPHLHSAQDTCRQYGERVCAELQGIRLAVQDEDITELREYYRHTIVAGETRTTIAEIPGAEEWQLEFIAVNLSAAGPVVLRNNGALLFAATPALADNLGAGCGIVVQGRGLVTLDSPGAAAGEIYVQFRRQQPPHGNRRAGGGQTDEPASEPPRTQLQTGMHAPTWQNGKTLTR